MRGPTVADRDMLFATFDHIVFVIVDGLGMNVIDADHGADFLAERVVAELTTVLPTSTPTVLTSYATGRWPSSHGVPGWYPDLEEVDAIATIIDFLRRGGDMALGSLNLGGPDVHARPGGVQNRMIRRGPWKLNYYHGFRPQLFNLADDPHETRDLAEDPAFAGVRAELTDRVLEGWDPDYIRQRMRVLKSEQQILETWASRVDPPDSLRWYLRPEMDYLEVDQ